MTYTTRRKVTEHPPPVSIALLLVAEHRLVGVTEGEVQGLGWEVTNDVGGVATPERRDTLVLDGTAEALANTGVLAVETAGLEHFILLRASKSASWSSAAGGLGTASCSKLSRCMCPALH